MQYTSTSNKILLFFDLGTAKEPFEVDLNVQICVCGIGISSLDIYVGIRLLSAVYASTALL